jgi:hypothetical protein
MVTLVLSLNLYFFRLALHYSSVPFNGMVKNYVILIYTSTEILLDLLVIIAIGVYLNQDHVEIEKGCSLFAFHGISKKKYIFFILINVVLEI